jgi:hypothetical protein
MSGYRIEATLNAGTWELTLTDSSSGIKGTGNGADMPTATTAARADLVTNLNNAGEPIPPWLS